MLARRERLRKLILGFLFWLALGVFAATRDPFTEAFAGVERPSLSQVLLPWVSYWLAWGLMSIPLARLVRRFPLAPFSLGNTLLHLVSVPVVSSLQLFVMQVPVHLVSFRGVVPKEFANDYGNELAVHTHLNVVIYLGILAGLHAFRSIRQAREREVLAALQMQIHPHFLFNSLHTASELVHENPALAETTLLRLAELLRRTLRLSSQEDTSLASCLEFLDLYLELEGVRLEGRLRVAYEVPEELLAARHPTLVLQPLVENAVRHGIAQRRDGGEIVIAARRHGGQLELEVRNDVPSEPTPARSGAGIGLANVRSRLAVRFGDAAALTAQIEGGRFVARLRMPLYFDAVEPAAASPAHPASEVLR